MRLILPLTVPSGKDWTREKQKEQSDRKDSSGRIPGKRYAWAAVVLSMSLLCCPDPSNVQAGARLTRRDGKLRR